MLCDYDKSEKAQMERDARNKQELEMATIKNAAIAEGLAQGHAEGKAEGLVQGHAEGKAEGLAQGHAEGKAEGLAQGHAEGKAEGLAQGHAEGHAEGLAQGHAELIKSMHESGMSAEAIAKVCKLELNYVLEILK